MGMSWQYWGFTSVGGFEIYIKSAGTWETPVVAALGADTTGLAKIVIAPKTTEPTEDSTEKSKESTEDITKENSGENSGENSEN
jgi:hypothetical protein